MYAIHSLLHFFLFFFIINNNTTCFYIHILQSFSIVILKEDVMPKFIEEDDPILQVKATKEFTDREEPRKVFWDKYTKMSNEMNEANPIQVISYYGFGGIGKSSLLHKLNEELKEKAPNSKTEFLDFERLTELNNNLLDILKVIRQDLKERYKFSFPIFDLVTYVYETKMGKTATKPELNSIFDDNKELGFLKDVISDIPLIGTFAKVIYYADTGKNLIQERLKNHKLRQRLLEIENSSAEEIKEHLAYYFSIDLKENLKKETVPFVFFIDTYEKLVNELTQVGDVLKNDLWLRSDEGLICRVPNVLWVIAGREKLKWQDMDESWEGTLEQHLLGTLSYTDASHFLKVAGIVNEELIHQIYNLTHGTPIYLDMCVDTFVKVKEKGNEPTINDFGEDTTSLIKRFLIYMNDTERDFTTMLAFVGEWTDDTISEISIKMLGFFSPALYHKIKDFSFITSENGKYKMHETVRDITIANASKIEKEKYTNIYQSEIDEKVKEIKKVKIANENSSNVEPRKERVQLNFYDSQEKYVKLISSTLQNVFSSKSQKEFEDKIAYLLEKIEDYEQTYQKVFFSDGIEEMLQSFSQYRNIPGYIKLETKYRINCEDEEHREKFFYYHNGKNIILDAYQQLTNVYGQGDKRALYPILDFIEKTPINWSLYKRENTIVSNLKEILEKYNMQDDVHYLKLLCGIDYIEFIKKMDDFHPKHISRLYIEVMCMAISQMYTWYSELGSENQACRYVYRNVNLIIETLEKNPSLLTGKIVKKLVKLPSICSYFEVNLVKLFDYVVSIKDAILETTDMDLIDSYYHLLLEYEHGFDLTLNNPFDMVRSKVKELLVELYERYSEIYGKDSSFVLKIKASLLKMNITLDSQNNDDIFNQMDELITTFGLYNERTINTACEIFSGIKDANEVREIAQKTTEEKRYHNFQKMISYMHLFLDKYTEIHLDKEAKNTFHNMLFLIHRVLQSYRDYFYYSHSFKVYEDEFEKYAKDVAEVYIKMDKLNIDYHRYIEEFFFRYAESCLTFGYLYPGNLFNKKYMLEGIDYLKDTLLKNEPKKFDSPNFLIAYIIYKVFELKKKVIPENVLLEVEKDVNDVGSKIYPLEEEYEKTYHNSNKFNILSKLIFFRLIENGYLCRYVEHINTLKESRDGNILYITTYASKYSHIKNIHTILINQNELVELSKNFYDQDDEKLLYEELILLLLRALFFEKEIPKKITSFIKRTKNSELIQEAEEAKKLVERLNKTRIINYGEDYLNFDDVTKLEIRKLEE